MTSESVNPFASLLLDKNQSEAGISKDLMEEVLLITLRKETPSKNYALLYMGDMIVADDTEGKISEELLSHALFERLLLENMENCTLTNEHGAFALEARETRAITYLFRAFVVCNQLNGKYNSYEREKLLQLILTNTSTCMRQPELFQSQAFHLQWLDLFEHADEQDIHTFLVHSTKQIYAGEDKLEALGMLKAIFYPLLNELQKQIAQDNIVTVKSNIFLILSYFVRDKQLPELGEIIIDYTTPNPNAKGGEYMRTLLGQLLNMSILPKTNVGKYEFFNCTNEQPKQKDANLSQCLSFHHQNIFKLVKQLLVLGEPVKQKMLNWIANCLQANSARGQMWSNVNVVIDQVYDQNASDAFMIGLAAVLLRLCEPLFEPALKVLLVDPTYCAVPDAQRADKQVHLLKMFEETCLLPLAEGETRLTADKYNFITELFFMTHKAYELGYSCTIERYTRFARDLHELQNNYSYTNPSSNLSQQMLTTLKSHLQKYLCMRNTLMDPTNDELVVKFFEASSIWLTEIALITEEEYTASLQRTGSHAPQQKRSKPLPFKVDYVPSYMNCVPEHIVDNIIAYLSFLRNFPEGEFIQLYPSSHGAFFRLILLYMGSAELMKNPHLRAKLAEALEVLLPKQTGGVYFPTDIFENHADRLKVVNSLLNVFVSIEMTGQSVQFEQKFNYRRPMYTIIEYLFEKEEQVQCFRDLAKEAELNMEAIEPPIFLRFINLLINDAIFLLDDSLSNLEKIREMQEAQASEDFANLPANEREQSLNNLRHLGMLTRFDNILGRDTINTLKLLTGETKSIFCHNSMVDRIAAMLNYFLLSLVGPQKDKFKVKDKKEFKFDPAHTVREICRIYINLSDSERFCLAVSQDGRSYSPQLFVYAETILVRIAGFELIGEINDFAAKVKRIETNYKEEQEFLADAPDEYLDPIMSTLMTDPVILPSSNVTVDRTTIARHLLSDQTDPFNRAPLTMDKVKSNTELKAEIEKWMAEKRAAGAATKAQNQESAKAVDEVADSTSTTS